MPRYAAFLRGINVSNRRVGNAELRQHLESLGLDDVSIFRASGNVILGAPRQSPATLAARIEKDLGKLLGFEVVAFLRTADEVRSIAAAQPFPQAAVESSNGKLQVAFLPKVPTTKARKEVLSLATERDKLTFGGRELYWLPSGRMLESDLNLRTIERLVGPWTMRTKGTVEQIAAKHF